jgi:hypothetical protein
MRVVAYSFAILSFFGAMCDADASSSIRMSTRSMTVHAPKARAVSNHTGPIVAFKHAVCKTPTCLAKHPTGEYMIPIRDKAGT